MKQKTETVTRAFVTVNEAAEILHVHQRSIRNWIKSGKIRAIKLGKTARPTYRISFEELERIGKS